MKLNLRLSHRISIGYLFIIIVAIIATLFVIKTLDNNKGLDERLESYYLPLYLLLKDTDKLLDDSYKLSNNWIYQSDIEEKEGLRLSTMQNSRWLEKTYSNATSGRRTQQKH